MTIKNRLEIYDAEADSKKTMMANYLLHIVQMLYSYNWHISLVLIGFFSCNLTVAEVGITLKFSERKVIFSRRYALKCLFVKKN